MDLRHISKSYGEQQLFKEVDIHIQRGDKIALIGANGTGKSTFLRIIAGQESFEGDREEGHNLIPSFYAQHQLESLSLKDEILEELKHAAPSKPESELRALLGCFLFSGDDVFKRIKVLSGGEKARVALAKTLVSEANFLLLDEPTNHLDIDSIEILIEALKRYEGTLILVSHNRYFISKLATTIWWIEDQSVRSYPGTYDEYVDHRQKRDAESKQGSKPGSTGPQKKETSNSRSTSTDKEGRNPSKKTEQEMRKLNRGLEEQEKLIAALEERKLHLEEEIGMLDPNNTQGYASLGGELKQLKLDLEAAQEVALAIMDQLIVLESSIGDG